MGQGGGGGGQQAFARTAAGVVALYSAGIYKGPEVEQGAALPATNKPVLNAMGRFEQFRQFRAMDMHYFYGHYYAAQAMYVAGGDYWAEWFPLIRDELPRQPTARRRRLGGCQICTHYATAMACIILQVPNNYLPILQK